MTFYGLSKMSTSHHWKTQQISTRPGSALYRSIHSNRRLAIYRTLPHLTLSTDIYLANTQSWKELQHVLAVFGRSSQSLLNIRHGCADIPDRAKRPSTRRQCSTPLHEVDCQDALMASQWMPISLLNVIRLVVEQGFCNHIDHQHFVYTQQGIFHVHVASLKGRKQTQISIRQLKAKVIHTYLSIARNLCLQHSFHEPLAR